MWMQFLFGVIAVTWLPVGLAASSATLAITIHKNPAGFLSNYKMSGVAFWAMTLLGWVWFGALCLALIFNPDLRGAGLALPGRKARDMARRLALRDLSVRITKTFKKRLAKI